MPPGVIAAFAEMDFSVVMPTPDTTGAPDHRVGFHKILLDLCVYLCLTVNTVQIKERIMLTATFDVIEAVTPEEAGALSPMCDPDGQLHVEALVKGSFVEADYGVPGSPRWMELDEIDVQEIVVNGVGCKEDDIKRMFGGVVYKELMKLIAETAEVCDIWSTWSVSQGPRWK